MTPIGPSEVTQLFLAILTVILGSMVVGIGPRSRRTLSRKAVSTADSTPIHVAERPPPTTAELLDSLETLIEKLPLETATDENSLESLALLKKAIGQHGDADIQQFGGKLFENAQKLSCLRYLIERTSGSDRILLGNMKLRTLKQLQAFERELDQLRNKAATAFGRAEE